jgi:hypothetical protein
MPELSIGMILKIQELTRVKPEVGFNWKYAQKEVPMKKMTVISIFLSMFFSVAALAEEHAEAALEHTQMAIQYGKAGHNQELVNHAKEALPHAVKAAEVAEGESKTHIQAAIKSLESAIEHGKSKASSIQNPPPKPPKRPRNT